MSGEEEDNGSGNERQENNQDEEEEGEFDLRSSIEELILSSSSLYNSKSSKNKQQQQHQGHPLTPNDGYRDLEPTRGLSSLLPHITLLSEVVVNPSSRSSSSSSSSCSSPRISHPEKEIKDKTDQQEEKEEEIAPIIVVPQDEKESRYDSRMDRMIRESISSFNRLGEEFLAKQGSPSAMMVTESDSIQPMTLDYLPLNTIRDAFGYLVVNQYEMMLYVWLPVLLNRHIGVEKRDKKNNINHLPSFPIRSTFAFHILMEYISTLSTHSMPISTPLALVLFHFMSGLKRLQQMATLLQLHVLPDSIELAAATLSRSKESPALRQAGMDMLWRLNEKSSAVRWLLREGEVVEAMQVAGKEQRRYQFLIQQLEEDGGGDQWDREERVTSINVSGIEFFKAAATKARLMGEKEAYRRPILFFALFKFLREWDYTLIATSGGRESAIAREVPFPSDLFPDNITVLLKESFGYPRTSSYKLHHHEIA